MDHATQVALLRRAFAMLDDGSTDMADAPYVNRVQTYTDVRRLEDERQLLFGQEPLLIALSSDLPAPGTYWTSSEGEVPLLLTRDKSGSVRALANVCRHRGARVAAGAGKASRWTCPYHGWTYDEGGSLVSMPCREGFEGIDSATLGLRSLPVCERHGMIFVIPRAGGDAIDVDAHLAGAQHELAAFGLAGYVPFARSVTTPAMNWKLTVDTFLEAYHVPSLHRQTLGPLILGSPALWDRFGRGGRLVAIRKSVHGMRSKPEDQWTLLEHATILYQLFPNVVLIYQGDHVELIQAYPGASPDCATVVFSLYTPGAVADEKSRRYFQANFELLVGTVCREDFVIGEQAQRGFHSGAQDSIIYGRNEPGLAHYHRMLNASLGRLG
ncbi:MAG TPA: SRPBCC family protein [Candidatus Binatia bacterium]|nr:SRPBCC family protein [Candidatus Binatia bacterium]